MGISTFEKVPKLELGRSQLEVALQFYMRGEEFPAVITLAGAAEELLGKIAESKGHEPSLKRAMRNRCDIFKEIYGEEAREKNFADLQNRVRNELKHFRTGEEVQADYEHEAAQMLTRALENYVLCIGSPHPSQCKFRRTMVRSWRAKQAAFTCSSS